MAVRPRGLTNTFNKYKKQGLSDTEAMERAIKDSSAAHAKSVKAEKDLEKKTDGRLKKLFKPKHSPAGKKFLKEQKKKTAGWGKAKKKKK